MLFISSRLHAIIDYTMAMILVIAPWFIDSADSLAAPMMFVGVGMFTFILAMVTDYELSAARIVPLRMHIMMDMAMGAFLLASPWLLGFETVEHGLHMVAGAALITVATFTVRAPKKDDTRMSSNHIQWV